MKDFTTSPNVKQPKKNMNSVLLSVIEFLGTAVSIDRIFRV